MGTCTLMRCGWAGPNSESFQDSIAANAGGGQANAFQLTRQNNRVTTVATTGDSIKLPPAATFRRGD
jgi:hypothetical protein